MNHGTWGKRNVKSSSSWAKSKAEIFIFMSNATGFAGANLDKHRFEDENCPSPRLRDKLLDTIQDLPIAQKSRPAPD